MKIVHICLAGMFTDGWTYQENLLTKYHIKAGHSVTMITSQWIYKDGVEIEKKEDSDYINEDGVKVVRLSIKNNRTISYRFKRYEGVIKAIDGEEPDVLFIHGCQFLDVMQIAKYAKNKKIRMFVDNHADFSNSALNFLSKNILHGVIWKYCAKKIEPYVEKYYGVLPSRVDFLVDVYGLKREKVDLLVMGADDEMMEEVKKTGARERVRSEYDIKEDDFLIVTGGKIDMAKKQVFYLADAIKKIKNSKIKLLIFGSVIEELKQEMDSRCNDSSIMYVGWADSKRVYEYFSAADLVAFPGRHSVYWEQAAGQGKPMIVKYWEGTTHVDCGGNVEFLYEDSEEEMVRTITKIVDTDIYRMMKSVGEKNRNKFCYSAIAQKSIEIR